MRAIPPSLLEELPMDELLMARVTQLKEIEDRLARIIPLVFDGYNVKKLKELQQDILSMIQALEAASRFREDTTECSF
jgi:hypothetical protein